MLSHTIGVFLKQLFLLVRHGGFELFFVPANQLQYPSVDEVIRVGLAVASGSMKYEELLEWIFENK